MLNHVLRRGQRWVCQSGRGDFTVTFYEFASACLWHSSRCLSAQEVVMLTRGIRLAGLTLVLGALLAPTARADTRFDVRIGVPGPRVVAPYRFESRRAELIWRPGYYVWSGYRRHWVPGR